MAFGSPSIVANNGETTSDNQTVITTTAAIPAGNYILAVALSNGDGTNEGETSFHTGLSVGGATLTKRREQSEAGSSAATSVTVSQWYGVNDTGSEIASGANVTLDLDAARADKRIVVITGTLGAGNTIEPADGTSLDVDNYISSGGSDVVAESTSGMTSEEHFHWRTAGCDSASTGWTGDATWTETHTNRQVTGSNGVGMTHKISTSTGETSDPSSNAGNGTEWASILAAYREVAAGGGAFELALDPGSYAVTGAVSGVVSARVVDAQPGSYAVTGVQAGVLAQRVIDAQPGSYAVTGAEAGLLADRILAALPGSYVVTGAEADLVHEVLTAFEIALDPGSYAVTGAPAGVVADRLIDAQPGSYVVTGAEAAALAARILNAQPGSYTLSGAEAQLVYSAAVAVARLRTLLGLGT